MQRLSSGKRINTSADDAAGHQIANRMTAEIQGIKMAIRNAADAQALLSTAEGAVEEDSNNAIKIERVSFQSSNGTLDTVDKALLSEAAALELEITRVADNTTRVSLISWKDLKALELRSNWGRPGKPCSFYL